MASWRGIAALWSMTSLFFLIAGVMALIGHLWLLGIFFLLVVAGSVGVGLYALRRYREDQSR